MRLVTYSDVQTITTKNKSKRAESSTARQNKSGQTKTTKVNQDHVYAPTAQTRKGLIGKAKVESLPTKPGSIRVRHREYIGDVLGTTDYAQSSYPINPGLLQTFPWLAQMAALYESYLFNSLEFEFESTQSTASLGSVILAVDFDASDTPPGSKQQILAYEGAVRTAPWSSCTYRCSKQNLRKFGVQRFIRHGNLSANQDIKTYDVGNLFVATKGNSNNSTNGELYVTYDVTLETPQQSTDLIRSFSSRLVNSGVGLTVQDLLGGASTTIDGGVPLRIRNPDSVYIDKVGEYIGVLEVYGTGFTDGLPMSVTLGPNVLNGQISPITIPNAWIAGAVGSNTYSYVIFRFTVLLPNTYLTFISGSTGEQFPSSTVLRIGSYRYDLD